MPPAGVSLANDHLTAYRGGERLEMIPFIPVLHGQPKVLEIGCGEGRFSMKLRPHCEVWGIEPYKSAADIGSQNLDVVLQGTFDEVSHLLPKAAFDLVICNDVIEHMTDHDKFFSDIRQFLRPEGWLIGSIPNIRFYRTLFEIVMARDFEYQDQGVLDRTHLRFFTFRSMERALKRANFKIERYEGINDYFELNDFSKLEIARWLFGLTLQIATLGRHRDIRYVQIGFRARL